MVFKDMVGYPLWEQQLHDVLQPVFPDLQSIFVHYCGSSIQGTMTISSATKLGVMELLTLAKDTQLCNKQFNEDELTRQFSAANAQTALAESGSAERHATVAGVKKKQIDVFLGYWSPTMTHMIEPFVKAGDIKVLATPNLVNAKYTLAVPDYLYEKGLKSFADITKFEKDLDGKIHGIEPGDDGNALIAKMIKDNKFGLKNFKLIETSEAGMLIATQRAIKDQKAIVFLGWEPHPMNVQMKMKYLQGGDDVFGPNYGEAKVYTIMPPSFEARCPNATALVKNLQFTPEMENQVMVPIMKKVKPTVAAKDYLKRNPAVLDKWLAGVKTFDGKDGLEAVKTALK
jgi:glycine betaine/proline transport system substrate-binding protein